MRLRTVALCGPVIFALIDLGFLQDAGDKPKRPVEPVQVVERTDRPIVTIPTHELWVEAFFTPAGKGSERPIGGVLARLKDAKESVRVQAYGFTSARIADALIDAKARGVDVRIVLDHSEVGDMHTRAWACQGAGIPVLFDRSHSIAHNKVMVIDGMYTLTGSYNYTDSAEARNAENLVVVRSERIAAQFSENWEDHAKHSRPSDRNPP